MMKAFLMFKDRDSDRSTVYPPQSDSLVKDLEMENLFRAMSGQDAFLYEIAKRTLLLGLECPATILYRQAILKDCLAQASTVRGIYALAVHAIEREKRVWGILFGRSPDGLLHRSVEVMEIFVELLKKLKEIADHQSSRFQSEGFRRLFAMISSELNDEYIASVEEHLERLRFRGGLRISAELGQGNKGTNYVLRMPAEIRHGWKDRLRRWLEQWPHGGSGHRLYYQITERDESGLRALGDLKGIGISQVAIALGQSTDHILSFFQMLRAELGFYVACLNLHDQLASKSEPTCFPELEVKERSLLSTEGLYDVSLSLCTRGRVVGNDLSTDGRTLIIITGANRGGKSTLLRSIGIAQMMMQGGMFVPANRFRASLCRGVFTHFKREEDPNMRSGKLDEELSRMSVLVDQMPPNSLILFNESFASTNEREGSEIARQVVRALLESHIRVCYVTHMFDLSDTFYRIAKEGTLFLRAERLVSGARTFRLIEAQPLPTSFGEDLFKSIFDPKLSNPLSGNMKPNTQDGQQDTG